MTGRRARFTRLVVPLAAVLGVALISGPALPAAVGNSLSAAQTESTSPETGPEPFTSEVNGLEDVDRRAQAVGPSAAQRRAAAALGADVRWNRYGTPSSVLSLEGLLGPRTSSSAVKTARAWLERNAALFGGARVVESLRLVNDSTMTRGSTGHAVLFRQRFGQLVSAVDGLVTVAVNDRGVVYVSSSLTQASASLARSSATLTPKQAWLRAAEDVGITKGLTDIGAATKDADTGFTTFRVDGIEQDQQVRLRAVAMSNSSVRPAYETNVVDVTGGEAAAYTSYVDAVTGRVLVRHNQVDNLGTLPMSDYVEPFAGTMTSTECTIGGPHGPYNVDAETKTITVGVNAAVPDTDIVIKLIYGKPDGPVVASADLLFSPEVLVYSPDGGVPAGDYYVNVCPYRVGQAQESGDYVGAFAASNEKIAAPDKAQPAWLAFLANPRLNFSPTEGGGRRTTMCWVKFNVADDVTCQKRHMLNNPAARLPWDIDPHTFLPSNTTEGNAAITAEAWTSPYTPGLFGQRPLQPDRTYNDEFSDDWNNSRCDPTQLHPTGNDILAAVTNLFASHNRMHDFSWYLGFTEANYNLQQNNFGNLGAEGDPEIGNAQAGGVTGGWPTYLGRDNANQITLQDGVPGITNQYLFQPIAGAFYSPCVDGDYDMTVIGHEYTHAITNRMVAGPDQGLSGLQAGAMGESWSDMVGMEYIFANGYDTGAANPWAVGPYVTGNGKTGIRNYAMNRSPLQYGDVGYDLLGPQVHADGEIWSATMFDVRQALVDKWDAKGFEYDNKRLQKRCVEGFRGTRSPHGPLPPSKCPGNNRWIALMFDSFLLQQSATSMLDARDAFVAADRARFHGNNLKVIWNAFARHGMGKGAVSESTDDDQPKPSYVSPFATESTVTVRAVDAATGKRVSGELFVSKYEARVTPVADTSPQSELGDTVRMVSGTYPMLFRADGYGITTFRQTVSGDVVVRLELQRNLASASHGATIAGTTGAGDTDASRNPDALIDDTEATNWGVKTATSVDESHPVINVDLAGGVRTIRTVKVSAMLRPAGDDQSDRDSGSRFTALRQFAIEVCTAGASQDCTGTGPEGYQRIFESSPRAFNSVEPRPLAPNLLLKRFNVPDTAATHVRLVVLENQCTGYAGYAGEQDADQLNPTDCKEGSSRDQIAHAAELQVYG